MKTSILVLILTVVSALSSAREVSDAEIVKSLSTSPLVVSGTIKAVVNLNALFPYMSEHNPLFDGAVVAADEVLKGDPKATHPLVLFATSKDIAWVTAPKFQKDQEGIWILHVYKASQTLGILNSADFFPKSDFRRIEALIHGM